MLCYLLETETNGSHDGENVSRRKGKAAEWRLWWECPLLLRYMQLRPGIVVGVNRQKIQLWVNRSFSAFSRCGQSIKACSWALFTVLFWDPCTMHIAPGELREQCSFSLNW
jgi:hypothetical protein